MTLFGYCLLFVFLYVGTMLGPGLFFVRRFGWQPLETLVASIALSVVLLFLVSFGCFAAGVLQTASYAVSAVAWGITLGCWKDVRFLWRDPTVRTTLTVFSVLCAWTLLVTGLVRHMGGGDWGSDWLEHFHRAEYFLGQMPLDQRFVGMTLLPARLPLVNVLCAFFMTQVGSGGEQGFEQYQVISYLLNLLVFFPCCLFALRSGGFVRSKIWLLAGLLAFNPSVMQNLSFLWTKQLAAFFVVLCVHWYLHAMREKDGLRMVCAFVSLAAGFLAHHSSGLYILFLAPHYLAVCFRKQPHRWRELTTIVVLCSTLLATWFGWSIATYGVDGTFGSNRVIVDFAVSTEGGRDYSVIPRSIYNSIVPCLLRGEPLPGWLHQRSAAGRIRDTAFDNYQVNLWPMMGSVGGVLIGYLLIRRRVQPSGQVNSAERWFWSLFVPFMLVVGVGGVFYAPPCGVAHLSLQPLAYMGLSFLAGSFYRLVRSLRFALIAGMCVDFVFGVYLQFTLQNYVFVELPALEGHSFQNVPGLSTLCLMNWHDKNTYGYVFLGDHLTALAPEIRFLMAAIFIGWVVWAARTSFEQPVS